MYYKCMPCIHFTTPTQYVHATPVQCRLPYPILSTDSADRDRLLRSFHGNCYTVLSFSFLVPILYTLTFILCNFRPLIFCIYNTLKNESNYIRKNLTSGCDYRANWGSFNNDFFVRKKSNLWRFCKIIGYK